MLAVVILAAAGVTGAAAAVTGDQTVLLVCTLISAVCGPVVVVVVSNRVGRNMGRDVRTAARNVTSKVEAVHHEIIPPSNGTTAGAQLEFTAGWIAWLYEELVAIGGRLGMSPHGPTPELPQVDPPIRPDDRRRLDHYDVPRPEENP